MSVESFPWHNLLPCLPSPVSFQTSYFLECHDFFYGEWNFIYLFFWFWGVCMDSVWEKWIDPLGRDGLQGDSVHEGNWHTASLCRHFGLQVASFSIHTPEPSIHTPGVGVEGRGPGALSSNWEGGRISARFSRLWLCGLFFLGALRGVEDSWDTQPALLSGTHNEGKGKAAKKTGSEASLHHGHHHHHRLLPPLPDLLSTCLSHPSTSWERPVIIDSLSMALLHTVWDRARPWKI